MKYENLTDEELVALAKNNDSNAINVLIARFENAIKIKANTYSTNHWIRDDLIQRGRIAVTKAISKFSLEHESKSKFATYVNTCFENEFKTAISEIKNKTGLDVDIDGFIENNNLIIDDRFNPEEIAIIKEAERELDIVSKEVLSKTEQSVYKLRNLGYKNSDIAKELRVDRKSVENTLTRIKQKLSKKINKNDID
jgi:RNA polymerase sigma factor (sigma-70 family)